MIDTDAIAGHLAKITEQESKIIQATLEKPKQESFGDLAFPCFMLAKKSRKNPVEIAKDIENKWNNTRETTAFCTAKATGPYVNFIITAQQAVTNILKPLLEGKTIFKQTDSPQTILIESPGPNTNKPLHLGHLRNMLLGSTIKRIYGLRGHNTHIVNVINDRGIHICKSMLAYKKWGMKKTPESEGIKSDHFVGYYYVLYAKKAGESEEARQELEEQAKNMLRLWEQGDEETIKLWKKMNEWVYEGFEQTYETLDFNIDKNYYESETYKGGKDLIMEGLEKGIFERDKTGAIIINLEKKGLGKKVLLRKDGTSVYITQDLNMGWLRYKDFAFDSMIYVVANEQEYHFKVLFETFKALDFPFAKQCHHFSYGMVELPSGKMKSREGTVIDTDDLIKEMTELAREEVKKRYDDLEDSQIKERSESIALSAIRFFFLKHDPLKNFVFDKDESLSFEGETGPYVQYTHARISSILRKSGCSPTTEKTNKLDSEDEKSLILLLGEFDEILDSALRQLKPSSLCHYLIRVCQKFNSYYAKHQIIQDDKDVEQARINLIKGVQRILAIGLDILSIDALERM